MYLCEASSVEGFVQQLAVSYLRHGYFFYVPGTIPEGKDPKAIDAKLIEKYGLDISKWSRARRKRAGFANVQYLRFERFFVLVATEGEHHFFSKEGSFRDVRRSPIRFAGYSIGYRRGRDANWHPSVRIDRLEFLLLKKWFLEKALTCSVEFLVRQLQSLRFVPYGPVRNQYFELVRAVNKRRKVSSLELVPINVIPLRRRVVLPFGKRAGELSEPSRVESCVMAF